jgi:molybdopterin converting factor small subunit
MATLKIASPLVGLMPARQDQDRRRATVDLTAKSWPEMIDELRSRFPQLASRVLTDRDEVTPAFVLVVNDEVVRRPNGSLRLGAQDEVCLLAAIAGG